MIPPQEAAINEFWNWFQLNGDRLRQADYMAAFHEIVAHFNKTATNVQLGMLMDDKGPWTLEICAGGIADHIPMVEYVISKATKVPGWNVVAFRQPREIFPMILAGAGEVYPSQISWTLIELHVDGKISVRLHLDIPADSPPDSVMEAGFIALDHTLGELVVMTRLAEIDFIRGKGPADARPLAELVTALKS